ncbi:hypothetical protein CUR178_06016 [Leishmania enriettii]|uniref:Uncharacterized protein n=1 Tax=Leishmania enriettii TaxID=5663 RepID=A0A836GHJ3_LEIEN|nr:hypothetical protein CUR178_06016 [Leishmania enriettii]
MRIFQLSSHAPFPSQSSLGRNSASSQPLALSKMRCEDARLQGIFSKDLRFPCGFARVSSGVMEG